MTNLNINCLNGLYAITDPELMKEDFIIKAEQAIFGGIKLLQYRNKSASPEKQEEQARALSKLCKKNNVLFIINDNVELAVKINADGVHLGQTDTNIQIARKQLGQNKIIGITCNNQVELAQVAQAQGADYVAFGRFFNSQTKPSAPQAEVSLLHSARKLITIPIVAIGGITPQSAPLLLNAGANMLAVIHSIFGQSDVLNATRQFVEIIDSPKVSV
jgi:thiamine-phosphate pyrophosphorylase